MPWLVYVSGGAGRCRNNEAGQDDGRPVRDMRHFCHWPSGHHVVVTLFFASMLTVVADDCRAPLEELASGRDTERRDWKRRSESASMLARAG